VTSIFIIILQGRPWCIIQSTLMCKWIWPILYGSIFKIVTPVVQFLECIVC